MDDEDPGLTPDNGRNFELAEHTLALLRVALDSNKARLFGVLGIMTELAFTDLTPEQTKDVAIVFIKTLATGIGLPVRVERK